MIISLIKFKNFKNFNLKNNNFKNTKTNCKRKSITKINKKNFLYNGKIAIKKEIQKKLNINLMNC